MAGFFPAFLCLIRFTTLNVVSCQLRWMALYIDPDLID